MGLHADPLAHWLSPLLCGSASYICSKPIKEAVGEHHCYEEWKYSENIFQFHKQALMALPHAIPVRILSKQASS